MVTLYPGISGPVYRVQPDQLNMAVLFWYLVKNDAGQVRFYKLLELHGHVYLVTLYSGIAGPIYSVQPDQINMAVLFWYLVKNDAGQVLQVT